MDEQQVQTPNEPVAPATQPDEPQQPANPAPDPATEEPATTPATPTEESVPAESAVSAEEDEEETFDYSRNQLPQAPQLDFSQLPVDENNLIDPNALAGTINQSIAAAEERATMRAQQMFQEQRLEEKNWDKAFDKYPDLKGNKELRDMVQNARLGAFTNELNSAKDPSAVKLATPSQMAERLFKHIGEARSEGMKQANENTVVQQSAHIETAGRRTDDGADSEAQALKNINNPNKEIATQARNELLRKRLGWQ